MPGIGKRITRMDTMNNMENLTLQFEQYELKGVEWKINNPKGHIIIMEGMEEHARRYNDFALFLNKNGYSVHALDVFGQGDNAEKEEQLGIWPVDAFIKQVKAVDQLVSLLKEEGKPVYLFSHSMGSFMCQRYLQVCAGHVDKVVLCGSGSKNPALGMGHFLAKITTSKKSRDKKSKFIYKLMFGGFNKKIKKPATPFEWLSFNHENVERYIADPKCGYGSSKGFCLEFIRGMKPLHKAKSLKLLNPDTKIFIISGSDDPVTKYGKSVGILKKMYEKYGVKSVEGKVYPEMRHEILNETNRQLVYDDVLAFFNA